MNWGVRIVEIGAKFFYQDANGKPDGDDYLSKPANILTGGRDSVSSQKPDKCVQQLFAACKVSVPGQPDATFSGNDVGDVRHCLLQCPFILGPKTVGAAGTSQSLEEAISVSEIHMLNPRLLRQLLGAVDDGMLGVSGEKSLFSGKLSEPGPDKSADPLGNFPIQIDNRSGTTTKINISIVYTTVNDINPQVYPVISRLPTGKQINNSVQAPPGVLSVAFLYTDEEEAGNTVRVTGTVKADPGKTFSQAWLSWGRFGDPYDDWSVTAS